MRMLCTSDHFLWKPPCVLWYDHSRTKPLIMASDPEGWKWPVHNEIVTIRSPEKKDFASHACSLFPCFSPWSNATAKLLQPCGDQLQYSRTVHSLRNWRRSAGVPSLRGCILASTFCIHNPYCTGGKVWSHHTPKEPKCDDIKRFQNLSICQLFFRLVAAISEWSISTRDSESSWKLRPADDACGNGPGTIGAVRIVHGK